MDRKNLEAELGNLIREAANWKIAEGTLQEPTGDDAFGERDACLTAIANAITNYVTGEITRRLTVPSEPTPPPMVTSIGLARATCSATSTPAPARRSGLRPNTLSASRPMTTGAAPTTPRRYGSVTRINRGSQPTTPMEETCTLKKGPQYHSENRLDRFFPAPRADDTPLENKASRLRRLSTERRSVRK